MYIILLLAFIARAAIVLIRPFSTIHADEIFQVLEPAHKLAFGYGVYTWEWREGVRSWMLPMLLSPVLRICGTLHMGPQGYVTVMRLLFGALSLTWVYVAYEWARRAAGNSAAIIAGCMVAFWPDMLISSTHTLTECFATCFFLPALLVLFCPENELTPTAAFWSGLLLGFGVMTRIQLLPVLAYVVIYVWLVRRPIAMRFLPGVMLSVAAFGALDWITWGAPFHSMFMYVKANIVEGRAANYGVYPWYWFLLQIFVIFGPLALFLIPAVRRDKHLAIIVGIVIAAHSAVAHKEVRFLLPVLPLIAVMISIGISAASSRIASASPLIARIKYPVLVSLAVLMLLILGLRGNATRKDPVYRSLYRARELAAELGSQPDVCGVELLGKSGFWGVPGGYVMLHKNVPVIPFYLDDPPRPSPTPFANYLLTDQDISPEGYAKFHCLDDICLYKRPGDCATPPASITLQQFVIGKNE